MLEKYRETIRQAYYWISFNPDARADMIISAYEPEYQSMPESAKEKYISLFLRYIGSKGRTMSPMITGPAKFPTERNRKALNAEENHYKRFRDFVEKVSRGPRERTKSPEDDLEDMLKKHARMVADHEIMIKINAIVRKGVDVEAKIRAIADLKDSTIEALKKGGFETFELSNSRARIKNTEERILDLKARIYNKSVFQAVKFDGGMVDIIDDRVCIIHDSRPANEVIVALKSHGFHWSPRNKYWCRKHTANAIASAKRIVGMAS